ncbi:hypothetical protein VTN77DRAFT_6406 [Rasamsonia byssochlamydoides]|uniref:uncharacterized protein n=1 Tax=Rasamsonia byssochlamydoides TaxID=89139 RepID=UPI0037430F23
MHKSMASVMQPLLRPIQTPFSSHFLPHNSSVGDFIGRRLPSWHPWHHHHHQHTVDGAVRNRHRDDNDDDDDGLARWRRDTRAFLSSRWGHYLVLLLVSVDVACIFADFLIELHTCELKQKHRRIDPRWGTAQEALGLVSLVFSCLFMLELIAATLSFGLSYFSSKFHVFDSLVIVIAFILDVALRGVVEEISSIVVVLRLWRVFKIIEELSAASADALEKYEDQVEELRRENRVLKRRLRLDDVDIEAAEAEAEAEAGGDEED